MSFLVSVLYLKRCSCLLCSFGVRPHIWNINWYHGVSSAYLPVKWSIVIYLKSNCSKETSHKEFFLGESTTYFCSVWSKFAWDKVRCMLSLAFLSCEFMTYLALWNLQWYCIISKNFMAFVSLWHIRESLSMFSPQSLRFPSFIFVFKFLYRIKFCTLHLVILVCVLKMSFGSMQTVCFFVFWNLFCFLTVHPCL